MRFYLLLVSALSAPALAAPAYPELNLNAALPDGLQSISEYFNMLASKVQQGRLMSQAPVCDLSKAQQPIAPSPLPPVTPGLTLKHVAIGRGTQNYTCDGRNETAAPTAAGAVATLFNGSCVAATYPDLLAAIPRAALRFNLTLSESAPLAPSNLPVSGHHFFAATTIPFFDLDTPSMDLGRMPCAANATSPAPDDAPRGQLGEAAVSWLKLRARDGATGDLQEVYRLGTAGGSAPKTCRGMPASFQVQYSAQYWFYQGTAENEGSSS